MMEWGFWNIFGIIMLPLIGVVAAIGAAPFAFIVGRELAGYVCSIPRRIKPGKDNASYRLAMLAAQLHADQWDVKSLSEVVHPDVGRVVKNNSGACYIGWQQISSAQFQNIYDRVVEEKAMIKLRIMNAGTAKSLKERFG